MGASVVEEYDNKQPVTSEQMIQMGLKLTFYPENIKNKYENFLLDNILTKYEYQYVSEMMSGYNQETMELASQQEEKNRKKEEMTELEFLEANLKAFIEYGPLITTEEQFLKVKEAMENKITQQKLNDKAIKKSQ